MEASLLHILDTNYPSFCLKCPRKCQKTYNFDIFQHLPKFAPLPLLNFGVDPKFDHTLVYDKNFRGGRDGDTFKTPSPYEQLLPLPTPYFKMFLERSLNDPHPPPSHFKHLSMLAPASTTPSPLKILIIHLQTLVFLTCFFQKLSRMNLWDVSSTRPLGKGRVKVSNKRNQKSGKLGKSESMILIIQFG